MSMGDEGENDFFITNYGQRNEAPCCECCDCECHNIDVRQIKSTIILCSLLGPPLGIFLAIAGALLLSNFLGGTAKEPIAPTDVEVLSPTLPRPIPEWALKAISKCPNGAVYFSGDSDTFFAMGNTVAPECNFWGKDDERISFESFEKLEAYRLKSAQEKGS